MAEKKAMLPEGRIPDIVSLKTKPPDKENAIDILRVIKRLEIGPPRLERRRLIAPYRVIQGNRDETVELIYRYGEDVFVPDEDESLNLASIMSAQVALNYGLFCDEMVFHGLLDRFDRRFIEEMARNTAREIYVKKIVEPNPYLSGPVKDLPLIKQKDYLRAKIRFTGIDLQPKTPPDLDQIRRKWGTGDKSRHAVLSSGGKDSLLTFGLLNEIGCETHPVFINESGRHWFTALNAYRYFSKNIPWSARVWCNADRVFNGMLRHMPFIRPDFANVRSDEYPIRLWTVAVFLFGALPIVRKRGAGRILIGNEFDTTVRLSHQGITHYDGLYDQSRYFDDALTRYYHAKGWGISQFSVVRPLSELLIEKVLSERYPELQALQTSCHATHKDTERVHPCGRCEKCRRIVGMLMALGKDPQRCGYSPEQIDVCLKGLETKEIHQETEGVQHLAFLLSQKGLIKNPSIGSIRAKENQQIIRPRFDSEKSPLDGIPVDLREPLYEIFSEHASGAAMRAGRVWRDFDLFSNEALAKPYPFEKAQTSPPRNAPVAQGPAREKTSFILGELTWPEARNRFKKVDIALLPVGSFEQHGPHLPLDTDTFDAERLAAAVASACTDPKPFVLPVIPYGISYHHEDFSGTISVNPQTLSNLIYDIGMSAARHGITKLVIINGHGGNIPALHFAAQMINRDANIFTCVDTGESSDPDIFAMVETPNDVHAGEIETSSALAVRPDSVRKEAIKKFVPRFSNRYLNFTSKRSIAWYAHVAKISPSGVLGDPTKATRDKGVRIWDVMIKHLVEFVEDLKALTLDEIYQKRY